MANVEANGDGHNAAATPTTSLSEAERARQREIASYLEAASITKTTPGLGESSPTRSADANLTALVQLGTLRLNSERSFLSLLDDKTQFIVAEATQNTSLASGGNPTGAAEENDLFLGTMLMDKSWGICPKTMDFFTDTAGEMVCNDPNVVASSRSYIIKDLQADPGLKDRPYVVGFPYMRSYLEVPLTSPRGYVIGGYCVIDNKLRPFTERDIQIMAEIGGTIVTHLECMRRMNQQTRSEKLIRGLDMFIQEEASFQASRKGAANEHESGDSKRSSRKGSISEAVRGDDKMEPTPVASPVASPVDAEFPASVHTLEASMNGLSIVPKQTDRPVLSGHNSESGHSMGNASSTSSLGATMPAEMRRAFERSATLIRESLGMDGLVFLDASPLSFGSRSKYLDLEDASHMSDEDGLPKSQPPQSHSNVICPILAASASNEADNGTIISYLRFGEQLLHRLIRRFPRGQLFSADEFGAFDKPDTNARRNSQTRSDDYTKAARAEIDDLFRVLPQARSVVFLPLWHFQKERWFAAAVGWTIDPRHAFDPSDRTYLSAFGNSIMAEVLRYEALAVSKAKSDFISSISHEIRSPLHGILATTELLSETVVASEERSMLSMIQSCGTTLLDTMEHLLEFAKINNLSQSKKRIATQSTETGVASVDISRLVEEVCESVAVGHAFATNPFRQSNHARMNGLRDNSPAPEERNALPVLLTLSIQPFEGWEVPTDTGAWKRIVMNLVGNALKYTPAGHIEIKLEIDRQGEICFVVKDTGIGMSAEYLKYRLFTPFSQENTFSSGTGLGLCIVQQIVQDLGGRLDVRSEVGVGTSVSVRIPLPQATPAVISARQNLTNSLRGLKLCYVEPVAQNHVDGGANGTSFSATDHAQLLKASIIDIATSWHGMEVLQATSIDDIAADVYILDKSLEGTSGSINLSTLSTKPIIIISNPRTTHQARAPLMKSLRAPIGPRQMAHVITDVLHQQAQARLRGKPEPLSINAGATAGADTSNGPASPQVEDFGPATPAKPVHGIPQETTLPSAPTPKPTSISTSDSTLHTLIVDDNAINLRILSKLLKQLGCSYATATNGLEAVQVFKAACCAQSNSSSTTPSTAVEPFSLIFMDISMPIMNGFEATQAIRAYEREMARTPVKVVALTGLGNAVSQREAFTSGMDLFLTKPVSLAKLKGMLVGGGGEGKEGGKETKKT